MFELFLIALLAKLMVIGSPARCPEEAIRRHARVLCLRGA